MSSKKYGRTWKKIRDRYIKQHPICEVCLEAEAVEVHHRTPVSQGGKHTDGNLLAVCHDCHTELHRKENKKNVKD